VRAPIGTFLAAVATLAALAACGSLPASPPARGGHPHPDAIRPSPAVPGPPGGSRAEAAALAGQLLARLQLPAGARRVPATPVPPSLKYPAYGPAISVTSFDLARFFAVPRSMDALEAGLASHAPAGMTQDGTGWGGSGSENSASYLDVSYSVQSVPPGVASAEVVLTIAPAGPRQSVLRADAQILWYPSRTAAEYIDPDRYHVLTIDATIYGHRVVYTAGKVVTSQALIARLAEALNTSPAQPPVTIVCPSDAVTYQLALSVSRRSRPVVVISATPSACGGSGITVNGHPQPALADYGSVASVARQALGPIPPPP
jgi:hypothetical protein